jgi:HPt (histidine-containing phosphotransfer) domain-containing protein
MSIPADDEIINWKAFAETRNLLGAGFVRILGYFREDGMKSLMEIEEAMRLRDSSRLVMPAHTLKGESWQFGAEKLGTLAEEIEITSRHYVEIHQDPADLVEKIAALRPMFEATLAALENEVSPLVERKSGGFGQRAAFGANNSFGRL